MDWVATFSRCSKREAGQELPARWEKLACKVIQKPKKIFARDLYWKMLYRNQKALRAGDWKYLSIEGDEFLFNLAKDERERANWAKREPKRLAELRAKYQAWDDALPKHPDASYSVPASKADLATPSS